MQIPVVPDLRPSAANERGLVRHDFSIASQLRLRALYDYLDSCEDMLESIRQDIAALDIQNATRSLEKFCMEADSWGFDLLYEIGLNLQMMLLNADGRIEDHAFREALRHSLLKVPELLDECEREYCSRLTAADVLDSIHEAE